MNFMHFIWLSWAITRYASERAGGCAGVREHIGQHRIDGEWKRKIVKQIVRIGTGQGTQTIPNWYPCDLGKCKTVRLRSHNLYLRISFMTHVRIHDSHCAGLIAGIAPVTIASYTFPRNSRFHTKLFMIILMILSLRWSQILTYSADSVWYQMRFNFSHIYFKSEKVASSAHHPWSVLY